MGCDPPDENMVRWYFIAHAQEANGPSFLEGAVELLASDQGTMDNEDDLIAMALELHNNNVEETIEFMFTHYGSLAAVLERLGAALGSGSGSGSGSRSRSRSGSESRSGAGAGSRTESRSPSAAAAPPQPSRASNGPRPSAPGSFREEMSKKDLEVIQRLTSMGFSERDATQAYLAVNRDEDRAANLLIDRMNEPPEPPRDSSPAASPPPSAPAAARNTRASRTSRTSRTSPAQSPAAPGTAAATRRSAPARREQKAAEMDDEDHDVPLQSNRRRKSSNGDVTQPPPANPASSPSEVLEAPTPPSRTAAPAAVPPVDVVYELNNCGEFDLSDPHTALCHIYVEGDFLATLDPK